MRVSLPSMAATIFLTSLVASNAFAQSAPSGASQTSAPPAAPAPPASSSPAPADAARPLSECKTTPTDAESEAAHGAYLAGKGSFDEADYTTAVTYFKDAYRRDCTKYEVLNALARAYELKGDRAEAVNALEAYLKRAPGNNPGNDAIQHRIAVLKDEMAAANAPAPPPAAAPPPAEHVSAPSPAPPAHAHAARAPWPWIVVGGGAVAAGAGIVLWAIGTGQVNGAKDDAAAAGCQDSHCPKNVDVKPFQDKNDSGTTKRTVGVILAGVGVAAIAGGLAWHFLEPRRSDGVKASLSPGMAPGYAGLSMAGSF